jgi:threonine 3-dehydrogenase
MTMPAVVKIDEREGPEGTEVREVAIPEPGEGEVRMKVRATAICGSDRHIYHWDPTVRDMIVPPRIYGHEFCGEIDAIGRSPGRNDLEEGSFASAEMHVTCGVCRQCRSGQGHVCRNTRIIGFHSDGSFAGYVIVPARNVVPLDPAVVPLQVGAFLDALGNAVHTVQDHELAGSTVAITGYGPIGAMAAAIVHHQEAARIYVIDISEKALERARRWREIKRADNVVVLHSGSDEAAAIEERILDETGGGVDLALEMSGAESAVNQALRVTRMGGNVSLLGIPTREAVTIQRFARDLIFKGLSLHAIIGRRIFSTWDRMLELLAGGLDVESLVSHEYEGLAAFIDGMEAFDAHDALKVVFYPHGKNGNG